MTIALYHSSVVGLKHAEALRLDYETETQEAAVSGVV
jgi:hypothetical protein